MNDMIEILEKIWNENTFNCLHFNKIDGELEKVHVYLSNEKLLVKIISDGRNAQTAKIGNFEYFVFEKSGKTDIFITKHKEKDQLTPSEPEWKMNFNAYAEIAKDKNLDIKEMDDIKKELQDLLKIIDENIEKKNASLNYTERQTG